MGKHGEEGKRSVHKKKHKKHRSKKESRNKESRHKASREDKFLDAVRSGVREDVLYCIFRGKLDLQCVDEFGNNAIQLACFSNSMDIMTLLVERGIDIGHVNDEGWTPLHAAVATGRGDMAALLLEHGASRLCQDARGRNALDMGLEALIQDYEETEAEARASRRERLLREARELEAEEREQRWHDRLADEAHLDAQQCGIALESFQAEWGETEQREETRAWAGGPEDDSWRDELRRQFYRHHRRRTQSGVGGGSFVHGAPKAPSAQQQQQQQARFTSSGTHHETGGDREEPCSSPDPVVAPPLTDAQLDSARAADDAAWVSFVASKPAELRFADVPWPSGEVGNILHLRLKSMTLEQKRAVVRAAQLRWHPDKFQQKFGAALDAADAVDVGTGDGAAPPPSARVRLEVKRVAQSINLLKELIASQP